MSVQDRINKAVGEGLWALASSSLMPSVVGAADLGLVSKEAPEDLALKALCIKDAMHFVSKEWREEDHPRGNGGRFGNGSGGPGPTRENPVHRDVRRAVFRNVPEHAMHSYWTELTGRPVPQSWDRGTLHYQILRRETAMGIVHGTARAPAPRVDTSAPAPAAAPPPPGEAGGAVPLPNADDRREGALVARALNYFANGGDRSNMPTTELRARMTEAGLIRPVLGSTNRVPLSSLTDEGRNLLGRGDGVVGAMFRQREAVEAERVRSAVAASTVAREGGTPRVPAEPAVQPAASAPATLSAEAAIAALRMPGQNQSLYHLVPEARDALTRAGLIEPASEGGHRLTALGAEIAQDHVDGRTDRARTRVSAALISGGQNGSTRQAAEPSVTPPATPVGPAPGEHESLHAAVNYFHQLTRGGAIRMDAVPQAMRDRLVRAGLIEPRTDSGHRITDAGTALANRGLTPDETGLRIREREADIAAGRIQDPARERAIALAQRQERERASAQERAASDARARAERAERERVRAAREAAMPGRSPATAAPAGVGPRAEPPAGTKGIGAGRYVLKEPKEGRTPTCERIPMQWKENPTDRERAFFGDKVPTEESLQKVWGHEAGGIRCKVNSSSVTGSSASYSGAITKKDPETGRYRSIGRFSRSFARTSDGKIVASHDLFKVDYADDQGGGLGAAMIGQAFMAYREMGVSKTIVHPAWVGPYAWAALGYNLPESGLNRLRTALVPFLKSHGIPEDKAKEHAENCISLSDFADVNLTPKGEPADKGKPGLCIHHVSDQSNRDGSRPEFDLHLGAKFLLQESWSEGTIHLDNPMAQSFKRVVQRTGAKP